MTYISKKEKVFDLPDQDESDTSLIKDSEHKLKIYPSKCDRGFTSAEDYQKYKQICGSLIGKDSNVLKSTGFKYIPIDVLIAILMAEKDAYIQELIERQQKCTCGDQLFRASQFDDSEDDKEALIRKDAEVVALKNRNAGLESELEECRDTLGKAVNKLESMEAVLNENKFLKDKLKYAEGMIQCLEDEKKTLEADIQNCVLRNGEILKEAHENEKTIPRSWEHGDYSPFQDLCRERNSLKHEVEILQKELSDARVNVDEIETLRKQSETLILNLEEVVKDNECYKQKLEAMKYLEKYVEDLKNQAVVLTEKYRRESQKSVEQMKQITLSNKELQMLRDEKDLLHKKFIEFSSFESEYFAMKKKLSQVEQIIDENEILNSKLSHLERLQSDNDHLRNEIERLKPMELELNDTRNKMVQLKCTFMDQEEEIKHLLSQIEILSKGYVEQKEFFRLKTEIQNKNEVIRQCEEQLKEIPILQNQLDTLRQKLQKYTDDFKSCKDFTKRLQDELEAYKEKCHELEKKFLMVPSEPTHIATRYEEKVSFTEELAIIQEVAKESCSRLEMRNCERGKKVPDISNDEVKCNENDADLREKPNYEELIKENLSLKNDLSEMINRTYKFKELLSLKDERIRILESEMLELKDKFKDCTGCQDLRNLYAKSQNDIKSLEEFNVQLQNQLNSKKEEEVRIEKLEKSLTSQKKACEFSKRLIAEIERKLFFEIINRQMSTILSKLIKEECLLSRKEICVNYLKDTESLKNQIDLLKTLVSELKNENEILHKMNIFSEYTGKKALTCVLTKLRSELLALQNLSKPGLEAECEALQTEVKRLSSEINRLVEETDDLKTALDAERKSKEYLEKEFSLIQKELSQCAKIRNKNQTEASQSATTMTQDFIDQSEKIKETLNEIKMLKDENEDFVKEIAILQGQCKDFQDEVTILQNNMDELDRNARNEKYINNRQKDEINALNDRIKLYEKEVASLKASSEETNQKTIILREELTAKEAEVDRTKKELVNMKNELLKLKSEVEFFKTRLEEKEKKYTSDSLVENNTSHISKESEDTILKTEMEFEELRKKLETCENTKEKLSILRSKRDNLMMKVNAFESEVEYLKKKVYECETIKDELEELKIEKKTCDYLKLNIENEEKLLTDIFGLREQLRLQQKEIENARSENTDLKNQLSDLGNLLELCKKVHNSVPQSANKRDIGIMANDCIEAVIISNEKVNAASSTSLEELRGTITINELKLEMAKMESKHKIKVQKIKEGNAEKIKRLMEQYEKESKNRNKAYNESLNTIKSNYENDIKKLVERHKSSILRLQSLHEDEVQELNTNYETQMEAMQTLNENVVNDLTSGAAEKCKLTEKYNKEIRDVELKFQKLLKEKENQHMTEISTLKENLTKNVNDLKDMHKIDIENLSRLYEANVAQLEEKHNREIKKCKRNNLKRTDMIRHKYEDLLTEERKKYEEQLQIMLDRLKLGDQGDQVEDLKLIYFKSTPSKPEAPIGFNKILYKVIANGLESLQFDELMLVHCKTCFAADNFFEENENFQTDQGDLVRHGCPHLPLLKAEKEELLKRIFVLENEIAIKQLETHEAIVNMESAEKCRMDELNALLNDEREKNAELKMLLNNHSRAQTDLKIESYMLDRQASLHETKYIEIVKELEIEKSEKRRLEEELDKEKNNSKRLSILLENERQRFKCQRKEDSDYIEAMRIRLEEALSHEQIMESQLDYEAQFRTKLESELKSLQRSFNLIVDQPNSALYLESKAVKDIKNLDQFESEKEEKICKRRNKQKKQKNI